jgi:glucose-6-phosphate dehydrogenase assembly protein OpcA
MEAAVTSLESFTEGRSIAVDYTAIERELAGLWKTASTATGEGGAGPAVMRACQLNLIILCSGPEQTRATASVAVVTRVRPSRVLMAVVEPGDSTERLEASISAHCSYMPGAGAGKQVCCEQITIAASGGAARRLPGAVLPLLLPDLPVVLWRPGDPDPAPLGASEPMAEVSSRLADAADRIVIDSRRLCDPAGGFGRLASMACAITDLAWRQLGGWRDLTASLFDGPVFATYPQRIETVRVQYVAREDGGPGQSVSRAEALLLACWVASKLGWEPAPAAREAGAVNVEEFNLWRQDGGTAAVSLHRFDSSGNEAGGEPGQLISLELEAEGALFALRRVGVADCVTASVMLPESCPLPRTVRIVERDEAALLCRALESGGSDAGYDETLQLAARLLAVRTWKTAP